MIDANAAAVARIEANATAAVMIVLVTDYGCAGPYIGQVDAVLRRQAPAAAIVHLFDEAPAFDPKATAYLLAAYVDEFPIGSVFLCVVDPGVGTERGAGVLEADGRWYVGPDNGLFEIIARRSSSSRWWPAGEIPATASATFHGRDVFAPIAAALASGDTPPGIPRPVETIRRLDWPDELAQVVFIDHFGNAMTGIRAHSIPANASVRIGERRLVRARTFADVPPGDAFWYENANGLLELAVNCGRADTTLGARVGTAIIIGET